MIAALGNQLILSFNTSFSFFDFLAQSIIRTISPPYKIREILKQLNFVSVESLPIVAFCVILVQELLYFA